MLLEQLFVVLGEAFDLVDILDLNIMPRFFNLTRSVAKASPKDFANFVVQLDLIHLSHLDMSIVDKGCTRLAILVGSKGRGFQVSDNIHFGHRWIISGNFIK